MELWIRSQDKTQLVKVNNLHLKRDIDIDFEKVLILNNEIVIGKYKSKERALEVLDEIQSVLNLKDMYKYDRELVLKSWENADEKQVKIVREQMSVYEMPEE